MTGPGPESDDDFGKTPLSTEELEGLLFAHVSTRGQLDELEQANIQQGMRWIKRKSADQLLTANLVRELHKKLFGEVWAWAGEFRKTGKNIGVAPLQIPMQLRDLLQDARYWIDHETFGDKELAARFHHRLVAIHPFVNGNGRHARIMADAVLTQVLGVEGIDWAGGQDLQKPNRRRKQYIDALRAADQGDYSDLLRFVGV